MPLILKLKCLGEVRRVQLQEDQDLTYEVVCENIRLAFPELGPHATKYQDDEGDLCTLCSTTFSDFLSLADGISGQKVLKLEIVPTSSSDAPMTTAEVATGAPATQAPAIQAPADPATQAVAAAIEALKKPEVQQALQSVQGLEGLAGIAQAFAGPAAAGFAQALAGSSSNSMRGFEGMQGLFQAFAGGAAAGGQPAAFGGADIESSMLEPHKLLWILAQLRATGTLSGKVVAGLAAHMMSRLVAKVVENVESVDCEVKVKLNDFRPVLEDLQALVSCTPGLEHCAGVVGAVLSEESGSAGEALLLLLTAIDVLPFEAQVDFLESFYNSQEKRLHELLNRKDEQLPAWCKATLEHAGITCDGCSASPLKGLRFKSLHADVDLCGQCFAQKGEVNGGQFANHEFQCIVCDLKHEVFQGIAKHTGKGGFWGKGKCKGKDWWAENFEGKGKDKGMHKGKGKKGFKGHGKGWWWANGGHQSGHHGGFCEQTPAPAAGPEAEDEATGSEAPEPKRARLSFPVVIEDGRKLTIEWEQGENPQEVAKRFAESNGIMPDELQTIVDFVANASVMMQAQAAQTAQESNEKKDEAPVSKSEEGAMDVEPAQEVGELGAETDKEAASADQDVNQSLKEDAKKLEEMGFGCAEELQVLLEACGGNVQVAIESLTK